MGGHGPPLQRIGARAEREERRNQAVKLSVSGHTYEEIAKLLGYGSKQSAFRDVKAALAERAAKTDLAVEEWRAKELALIDDALKVAHEILNSEFYAHAGGRVVRMPSDDAEESEFEPKGAPLVDRGPNLAAAKELIRISESRRKLLGTDAPQKIDTTVAQTVNYQVAVTPEELEQL